MAGPVQQTLIFLVQVLFGLYGMVIVMRLLLRMARADYYNPFVQVIVKLTNRPVKLIKSFCPDVKAIEIASVVFFVLLEIIKLTLICILNARMPHIAGLIVWAAADLLAQVIQLMFYLVIIRAILSWVSPQNNAITQIIGLLTEPLMGRARRWIPPIGALDISPIAVLILLQVISILLVNPLVNFGMALALG